MDKIQIIKPFGSCGKVILFTICGYSNEVVEPLCKEFEGIDNVAIVQGNILNVRSSAIVSPANSFGEMSGGLDKQIDNYFKGEAQTRAISVIRNDYFGELPVGKSMIIKMNDKKFQHLILSPTMRLPGILEKNSINAYLAMRGLLVAIANFNRTAENKMDSVAIPSLCTGVGGMSAEESASQMYVAYENVDMSNWRNVLHPAMAPYATR